MIVCHCNAVSDRTIRRVVQDGARSVRQVAGACGAGVCCGGCRPAIHELIASEAEPAEAPGLLAPVTPALSAAR